MSSLRCRSLRCSLIPVGVSSVCAQLRKSAPPPSLRVSAGARRVFVWGALRFSLHICGWASSSGLLCDTPWHRAFPACSVWCAAVLCASLCGWVNSPCVRASVPRRARLEPGGRAPVNAFCAVRSAACVDTVGCSARAFSVAWGACVCGIATACGAADGPRRCALALCRFRARRVSRHDEGSQQAAWYALVLGRGNEMT